MKSLQMLILALAVLWPASGFAAPGEAQVTLYCLSLRVQPAAARSLGLNYTLTLTTDSPANTQGNGELAPLPVGAPQTHGCFYRIEGDVLFEPGFGTLGLNIPEPTDLNTNGVPDFFEVGQAISGATSTGTFADQYQSGKATAVWNRAANSKDGACRLTLDAYGVTFTHAFEIQEFSGILKYSVLATNVTGSISVSKQADPAKKLGGQVAFDKISADRLALLSGTWTNETRQVLAFDASPEIDRQGKRYTDFLVFKDGDPSTALDDYALWVLSITDDNDANRNGIPDLSDEVIPTPPTLTLARGTTNLLLTISGPTGKVYEIERASAIPSTNWVSVTTLIVTNNPQAVSLPRSTNTASFWRVKLP